MELTGEYVGCDGETRRLRVSCEASGDANPLQSLSAGVARMKELVAEFFGPLVERDAQGATADPEDAVDGERGGGAPGVSGVGSLCEGQPRESEPREEEGAEIAASLSGLSVPRPHDFSFITKNKQKDRGEH